VQLLRILRLILDPSPGDSGAGFVIDDVRVDVSPEPDGESPGRIMVGRVDLPHRPKVTADGYLVLPERERRQAEIALETAANLLAVEYGVKRRLSSPNPYVALEADTHDEREWLDSLRGILDGLDGIAQNLVPPRPDVLERSIEALDDRRDGVALMAEALAHEHATGRFHELLRVFERGFRLAAPTLGLPLADFLDQRLGYTAEEVEHWVSELRHPATHADVRQTFVLESDVRGVIARMHQAAFDVLMNKRDWATPSTDRRSLWRPNCFTTTAEGHVRALAGTQVTLGAQLLDRWAKYPLNLETRLVTPESWWPTPGGLGTRPGHFEVVAKADWDA
jgi:hypothetical protein